MPSDLIPLPVKENTMEKNIKPSLEKSKAPESSLAKDSADDSLNIPLVVTEFDETEKRDT